jgi:DNA-binding response OmpR family regulator
MLKFNQSAIARFKPRILICDREHKYRNLLHEYLLSVGFHTDLARNGLECIELACLRYPDVILLDHDLPKLTGEETIKKLRSMGINIPVILFSSAKKTPIDKDSAVLPKPFHPKEIAMILETILRVTKKEKFFIPNRFKVH